MKLYKGNQNYLEGDTHMATILDAAQVSAYLERLGLRDKPGVSREALDELTFRHQCSIPFETIDMWHCTEPPVIDIDSIFQKIVTVRRGGFCFELNYAFETLLNSLGFKARPILSRAVRGRDGRMPINHRGVLIDLDGGLLFADVGFGGPLAPGSLILKDQETQVVRGETYITRKVDDCWWAIDRKTQAKKDLYGDDFPSRIQTELELSLAAVEDIDFAALNLFFSQPGTVFHDFRMANLRTEGGFYALKEAELSIRNGTETEKVTLPDDAAFIAATEKYFGFTPPQSSLGIN